MIRRYRSRNYRNKSSKFKNKAAGIVRFENVSSGLLSGVNFSAQADSEERISKKALILVEGVHTDNSGKKHEFTSDDINFFAEATNDFLDEGGRIPWQSDHDKKQESNLGDLENYVVPKIITNDDLPDPKLAGKLVGKLGLFATELVGKGKQVVEQIRSGQIKTLSPGIDIKTGIIREISATPTPAIVGMSIFSRGGLGSNATTWEEAESTQNIDETLKEDYENLTETLWNLATNIVGASDEEIPMSSRQGKLDSVMQGFGDRLIELLGFDSEENALTGVSKTEEKARGLEGKQANHRTERLSLSSNLKNINTFERNNNSRFTKTRSRRKRPSSET